MAISYTPCDFKDIDIISPLWEKLNDYHREGSEHFSSFYASRTFAMRKEHMQAKIKAGSLIKVDTAMDGKRCVGYCISTISIDGDAEIDSMFVEPDYRRRKIGETLMKRALGWMDIYPAKTRRLSVAIGNKEALKFYRSLGFYPHYQVLCQKMDDTDMLQKP